MYQHDLQSINNQYSRYKNLNNPTCIDLFLTNCPKSFYKTKIFLTGLSDSRKHVPSIFKTTFTKPTAKEIIYQDFERFNEQCYTYLSFELIKMYRSFEYIFLKTLNKLAPIKQMLRPSQVSHIAKAGIFFSCFFFFFFFNKHFRITVVQGRGRLFFYLIFTISTRFTDT